MGLKPLRATSIGPLNSVSFSTRDFFIGGVPFTGLVILNFCGVLISLKSIFSGVRGILSGSPSRRRFRGVERKVTPSLGGENRPEFLGGVRTIEWKDEFRFKSISGDHVVGRRLRPGRNKK